jgi:hypothetical protein
MTFAMSNNGGKKMESKVYKKAVLCFMAILALLLVGTGDAVLSPLTVANARTATIYVSVGKVVAIQTNVARRGIMDVKSNRTGAVNRFYLGNRTAYYPHRYPSIGETVKVHYYDDRGYLKATSVEIQ